VSGAAREGAPMLVCSAFESRLSLFSLVARSSLRNPWAQG
jgi:hypothetical protein